MKHLLLALLLALPLALCAQDEPKPNAIEVLELSIEPNTRYEGVHGIMVHVQFEWLYDAEQPEFEKSPAFAYLQVRLEGPNGAALQVARSCPAYKQVEGAIAHDRTLFYNSRMNNELQVFFPSYVIDAPAGKHQLRANIAATYTQKATSDKEPLAVTGQSQQAFTHTLPPKEQFALVCRGVRVEQRDMQDRPWDTVGSAGPDLKFSYRSRLPGGLYDLRYATPQVKNSYSAAWLDFSPMLSISQGDSLFIYVQDYDAIGRNDNVGKLHASLPLLRELAARQDGFQFGLVTYCLIELKED